MGVLRQSVYIQQVAYHSANNVLRAKPFICLSPYKQRTAFV